MKKNYLTMVLFLLISLTGCTKYEEDISYETDLYGTYSYKIEGTNILYSSNETYILNDDDTYYWTYKEVNNDEITKDYTDEGKILSIDKLSDEITIITLDKENIEFSNWESTYEILYKYKNMLGTLENVEIPDGETFELHLSNIWFDEEGQYHICTNKENCICGESLPKYIRKDNIIYLKAVEKGEIDYYIFGYITDNGFFYPQLYKEE
jgi:hypothetical protein